MDQRSSCELVSLSAFLDYECLGLYSNMCLNICCFNKPGDVAEDCFDYPVTCNCALKKCHKTGVELDQQKGLWWLYSYSWRAGDMAAYLLDSTPSGKTLKELMLL